MKNLVRVLMITCVVLMGPAQILAQGSDPCNCKPERGKKPYRLQAKTETNYGAFAESKTVLTPQKLRAWEKKYSKKVNGKTVARTTPRLKNTPEDSLYTLVGYLWYVRHEEDCDFHIQIGPKDKASKQRAVVEVTIENCALQKVIQDTMAGRGYSYGEEFKEGIPVTVVGLGFYDWQHGIKKASKKVAKDSPLRKQEGTAWELHPVREILFK